MPSPPRHATRVCTRRPHIRGSHYDTPACSLPAPQPRVASCRRGGGGGPSPTTSRHAARSCSRTFLKAPRRPPLRSRPGPVCSTGLTHPSLCFPPLILTAPSSHPGPGASPPQRPCPQEAPSSPGAQADTGGDPQGLPGRRSLITRQLDVGHTLHSGTPCPSPQTRANTATPDANPLPSMACL